MNFKVIGKGKNVLRLEFEEKEHAFLNLLKATLWEDTYRRIDAAFHNPGHPYIGGSEFYLKTTSEDPVQTMKRAARKIQERCREMQAELKNLK